jgi:uncharacterized protein (TIGR03437 family)
LGATLLDRDFRNVLRSTALPEGGKISMKNVHAVGSWCVFVRRVAGVVAVLGLLALNAAGQPSRKVDEPKPKAKAVKNQVPPKKREAPRVEPGEGGIEQRFDWFYSQRAFPLGYIPAGYAAEGVQQMNILEAQRDRTLRALGRSSADIAANATTWTSIGSAPAKTNGETFPLSAGRIAALAVDPRNNDVVYVGTAAGGVWKTTNGGTTWAPLTDTQPSSAIGALAIDRSKPDTVYAGTGEKTSYSSVYDGAGILKSTDAGATWTYIPGPFVGPVGSRTGGARISSLAVHPTNSQIVLATAGFNATFNGIWRSSDAGATWTRVASQGGGNEVFFDSTGANAFASMEGVGVFRSTDAGATWTSVSTGLPSSGIGRIEIALSPSNAQVLYAGVTAGSGTALQGFYTTVDGGAHWTQLASTPNYCAPQCGYDHFVTIHPTDPKTVFVGGADRAGSTGDGSGGTGGLSKIFRSTDSGVTWTEVSQGPNGIGLHPDLHIGVFTADGSKLFIGHDGGVNSTTTPLAAGVNWTDLNATFATTQYYPGISIHPTDINIAIAGTQDNGTQRYTGQAQWSEVTCGDGGWTAIDPSNPNNVYATCQEISINKSTTGGAAGSFAPAQKGMPAKERGQFIPPFVIDPTTPSNLYFGTYRVWQSTDGAGNWTAISQDLGGDGASNVSTIAVSPSDSNTVYAGTGNGLVFVTSNAGAGASATWTSRSTGLPSRYVTQVTVNPKTATSIYATFSGFKFGSDTAGHVFRSTDGGTSWSDISGTGTGALPNVPANDLVVDPDVAGTLYLATDVGVFVSANDGGAWTPLGSGLPRVPVTALRMHRPTRILRASTYGRSMWDLSVPVAGAPPTLPTLGVGGTVNGATFKTPVVAGSIASVFGSNLGTAATPATTLPLPTTLAGVSLSFNETTAAPIFFSSAGQVNVQVPWELTGQTSAALSAKVGGVSGTSIAVALAPAGPGIFTTSGTQGAVLNAVTGVLAAPAGSVAGRTTAPVVHGTDFITIYCTGLGDVDVRPATGAAATGTPLSNTKTAPTLTIGGVAATPTFSGLAPGFVGLYQVNAQVPAGVTPGDAVAVILTIGGVTSNTVTIAVQ